jgi:hypothetical protein
LWLRVVKYEDQTTKKIQFIGYNAISPTSTGENKFELNSLRSQSPYDNPTVWTKQLWAIGKGLRNDNGVLLYPNPVKANMLRVYTNSISATHEDRTENYIDPRIEISNRKDFLFYVDNLFSTNVTFTDYTQATFSVTLQAAGTLENNRTTTNSYRWEEYRDSLRILTDGFPSKTGRLLHIFSANNYFPEMSSITDMSQVTIVINSNGSGMKVNGVTQANYTVPLSFRKAARWAAQNYAITNYGAGFKRTGKNRGLCFVDAKSKGYTFLDGSNNSENFDVGSIYARIDSIGAKVLRTGSTTIDYYLNNNEEFATPEYTGIRDLFCAIPMSKAGQNLSSYFTNVYTGDPIAVMTGNFVNNYYDYEGIIRKSSIKTIAPIKYNSDYSMINSLEELIKNGIFPFINAFWSFQNFNYAIYDDAVWETDSSKPILYQEGVAGINYKRHRAMENYMQDLSKKVDMLIKKFGFACVIIGNESNLDSNLQGSYYGANVTFGAANLSSNGYYFFADLANQNKTANVLAMANFFNQVAKQLKDVYGDRVFVGPSVQIGGSGQASEMSTALNTMEVLDPAIIDPLTLLPKRSYFDFIGNNFYCNGSTTQPYLTFNGGDPITTFYSLVNEKVPMIMTECGVPRKVIDWKENPYSNPSFVYTDFSVEQAGVATNLIKGFLKGVNSSNTPLVTPYPYVQGLCLFGSGDQPGRGSIDSKYGPSVYESFYQPAKNFVSLADSAIQVAAAISQGALVFPYTAPAPAPANKISYWEEKFMSHLHNDTPRAVNLTTTAPSFQSGSFGDSVAQMVTKELPAMAAVRNEIATMTTILNP